MVVPANTVASPGTVVIAPEHAPSARSTVCRTKWAMEFADFAIIKPFTVRRLRRHPPRGSPVCVCEQVKRETENHKSIIEKQG